MAVKGLICILIVISLQPDLMLEVSRSINSVDFHTVYKSEVALKTKDPR